VRLAKEMALQPVDGFLIEGLDVSLDRGESANIDAIIPLINETVVSDKFGPGLNTIVLYLLVFFTENSA
jgi:hypothetical protein